MTEPFDAVLAEMRESNAIMYADELADRLAAAHAAEVAVKKSLAKEVWAAIARVDAAVGLLRKARPFVATYPDLYQPGGDELAIEIDAALAQQAQVGGENGNGG